MTPPTDLAALVAEVRRHLKAADGVDVARMTLRIERGHVDHVTGVAFAAVCEKASEWLSSLCTATEELQARVAELEQSRVFRLIVEEARAAERTAIVAWMIKAPFSEWVTNEILADAISRGDHLADSGDADG